MTPAVHIAVVLLAACGGGRPATVATSTAAPAITTPAPESDSSTARSEAAPPASSTPAAVAKAPPLSAGTRIACDRLLDAAGFTSALGEAQPLTVNDVTKNDPEAAASCELIRGGKRLTEAEQRKLLKKRGRLGVLPGDAVCRVTAYCWTIESAARFDKLCTDRGNRLDESLGANVCVQVIMQGADDVNRYQMLDDDTRCVLTVSGGPSNGDNEQIRACAKTARDLIGPAAITAP